MHVTACRKQPHPIPAMASNASLDGARSTVPRYSAMAAWRTSSRRDPAIENGNLEQEFQHVEMAIFGARSPALCRFGNRPLPSRGRDGRQDQRCPFLLQTWTARAVSWGPLPPSPPVEALVEEEETMSAFCRELTVAEHCQPHRASFAASQVVMTGYLLSG